MEVNSGQPQNERLPYKLVDFQNLQARRSQKDMKAGLEQVDLVMKAKREEITEHMEGVVGVVDDEKVISDPLLSEPPKTANHTCVKLE